MFLELVAMLLMVTAAYPDEAAVKVCDLAADHDKVSSMLLWQYSYCSNHSATMAGSLVEYYKYMFLTQNNCFYLQTKAGLH